MAFSECQFKLYRLKLDATRSNEYCLEKVMEMQEFGKTIVVLGVILVVLGAGLILAPRLPFLGRLPGDLHWEGKYGSFNFPIETCIVLSILASLVLNLFFRR